MCLACHLISPKPSYSNEIWLLDNYWLLCSFWSFLLAPRNHVNVCLFILLKFPCHNLTQLTEALGVSHLSWLHPLGVAPSEKLPWEQEEHDDFLRVGCHIEAPWSIKSGGVTATHVHGETQNHCHRKALWCSERWIKHSSTAKQNYADQLWSSEYN